MRKRILITGAAGFIGCNAVSYFADRDYEVYGFDNLSRVGASVNLAWLQERYAGQFTFVRGDVRKLEEVLNVFQLSEPNTVVHLAGQVAVTTSIASPRVDFETNALGTFNVLEAIRLLSPGARLIFASTNKVYGDLANLSIALHSNRYEIGDGGGVSETQPLDFYSPYGCSKGAADQYVRDYRRIYGLDAVVLRQSCVYGSRQFGVEDQGWVAWFALRAMSDKKVTVFGSGNQVRDLLNVDDLVRLYGIIADSDSPQNDIYNVGGGYSNSLSINELIRLLGQRFGLEVDAKYEAARQGDQKYFVSDNSRLEVDYGWKPEINLEAGLPNLLEWLEQVPEHFIELP